MSERRSNSTPARNWKLTLSYDGTDYRGWQIQPGERTVQGELKAALERVLGEGPLPQGSGRTDAGVHALGQVASFVLAATIPEENLMRALNRTLPDSIRVLEARVAPEEFHARHSATAKTYEYRVLPVEPAHDQLCPPFLARYVYAYSWRLEMERLQAAAKAFEGEHDFLSFMATDPELGERRAAEDDAGGAAKNTVRTIYSSRWDEERWNGCHALVYRVRGNGFLHHMVRNLVGTMLDAGRGFLAAEAMLEILDAKSRAKAGPTAPARGLYLHSVEYDATERDAAQA